MISVTRRRRFEGARYQLAGEISLNAGFNQALDFPDDGVALVLTGLSVKATFRRCPDVDSADVTLTSAASQIVVTDADTLTFAATPGDLTSLCEGTYTLDIATSNGSITTHLAQGQVTVRESPVTF